MAAYKRLAAANHLRRITGSDLPAVPHITAVSSEVCQTRSDQHLISGLHFAPARVRQYPLEPGLRHINPARVFEIFTSQLPGGFRAVCSAGRRKDKKTGKYNDSQKRNWP